MLERFKEFRILAAYLNFTKAAVELGESQPCLTRHINEFESELGFKLFERNPVRLTPAGEKYLEGFSQINDDIARLIADCRDISSSQDNTLSLDIVAYDMRLSSNLYRALRQLTNERTGFSYKLIGNRDVTIEEAVLGGLCDVGFVYSRLDGGAAWLQYHHLFDQPFKVFVHRDGPLAGRRIKFQDLSALKMIVSANRGLLCLADGSREVCARFGCEMTFRTKNFDDISWLISSIREDEAIIGSSTYDNAEMLNPDIVVADIDYDQPPTFPVYAVTRKSGMSSSAARFIEIMQEFTRGW